MIPTLLKSWTNKSTTSSTKGQNKLRTESWTSRRESSAKSKCCPQAPCRRRKSTSASKTSTTICWCRKGTSTWISTKPTSCKICPKSRSCHRLVRRRFYRSWARASRREVFTAGTSRWDWGLNSRWLGSTTWIRKSRTRILPGTFPITFRKWMLLNVTTSWSPWVCLGQYRPQKRVPIKVYKFTWPHQKRKIRQDRCF